MASTIIKILDSNQCYPNTYSETTVKNPPTQITFSLLFLLFFRLYVYSRWFRCVCVFVYSLSPSIINYACPNFRITCAMLTLQHRNELVGSESG